MFPHLCKYIPSPRKVTFLCHRQNPSVSCQRQLPTLCEAELLCLCGKDNLTTSSALPDRSPHAAIYASDLHCMVKHLLYRFMKTDAVDDTSLASLPELNLVDSSFMRKSSDIDIGFTADTHLKLMQRSTKSKVSDRNAMGLRPFHARLSLVSWWKHQQSLASCGIYHAWIHARWLWTQMAVVPSCAKCCRHLSIARNWLQRNVMTFCGSSQIWWHMLSYQRRQSSQHLIRSMKVTTLISSWKSSSTAVDLMIRGRQCCFFFMDKPATNADSRWITRRRLTTFMGGLYTGLPLKMATWKPLNLIASCMYEPGLVGMFSSWRETDSTRHWQGAEPEMFPRGGQRTSSGHLQSESEGVDDGPAVQRMAWAPGREDAVPEVEDTAAAGQLCCAPGRPAGKRESSFCQWTPHLIFSLVMLGLSQRWRHTTGRVWCVTSLLMDTTDTATKLSKWVDVLDAID